ncbi:MAG: carbon starvation protein A [Candidatus Pacearchaeota archaeon]|nr:carbon starvation protein A [Candidatus Pacearchaeota archaeon]
MNSTLILVIGVVWLAFGYFFYGKFLEKQIRPNDKNKTPAVINRDKGDYSPSKKPLLFGHHFASIAGAGPIIGPILAVSYFGWLPVALWITLGSVLIGGVHDYVVLMASVRNKAKGISVLAKNFINQRAGWVFGFMIWLTLVLIITVFSVSTADSVIEKPELVIPITAITIIAIILGVGVEKFKFDYKKATLIGIFFVFFSIWLGYKFPLKLPIENPIILKNVWVTIIILYTGVASVLPVWLILRPRDYISSIQLFLILALGFVGILIVRPEISAPMIIKNSPLMLWPFMFIIVACGAVSGFHSLVSSGTTSKQLAKESDGKAIAYGSMILEGFLALLVLIVVISGIGWSGEKISGIDLSKGWIVVFSTGFGNIVSSIGIPFLNFGIVSLLGALMINQFILTSVDSSARLGRYVISESLIPKLKNKFVASFLTLIFAWILAITNSYETLWRLFGSSNQLIAAISLVSIASYLVAKNKKVWYVVMPMIFVLLTTISALLFLVFRKGGFFYEQNWLLCIISLVLVIFGLIVAVEGFFAIRNQKHKKWRCRKFL